MKVDKVIAAYVQLRDKKAEVVARQKEELAPLVDQMLKLEAWLHRELLRQGVNSFKTDNGTAFVQTNTSVTVQDWEAALGFIISKGLWDFLEARVSKSAVADFVESHGDAPPGVSLRTEQVVRIRR